MPLHLLSVNAPSQQTRVMWCQGIDRLVGDRLCCPDRSVVVGLAHLIGHILRVTQTPIPIDDKHCPLQEPPFLDEYTIIATELLALVR